MFLHRTQRETFTRHLMDTICIFFLGYYGNVRLVRREKGRRVDIVVMEVSRPDFMGLDLVSVSSLKGLGLVSVSRFKGLGLTRDYSIETTRPEEKK